ILGRSFRRVLVLYCAFEQRPNQEPFRCPLSPRTIRLSRFKFFISVNTCQMSFGIICLMYKIEKKLAKLLKRVPVIWAFIIPAVLVLVIIGLAALIVIQRSENNRLQEDLISLSSELQDRESEKRSIEEQLSEKTQ